MARASRPCVAGASCPCMSAPWRALAHAAACPAAVPAGRQACPGNGGHHVHAIPGPCPGLGQWRARTSSPFRHQARPAQPRAAVLHCPAAVPACRQAGLNAACASMRPIEQARRLRRGTNAACASTRRSQHAPRQCRGLHQRAVFVIAPIRPRRKRRAGRPGAMLPLAEVCESARTCSTAALGCEDRTEAITSHGILPP